MTDAANYAKVFRAAAEGAMRPFQMPPGFQSGPMPYSSDSHDHAKTMSGAFAAIAEVFEKIAEAEAIGTIGDGC